MKSSSLLVCVLLALMIGPTVAADNPVKGEQTFQQCAACHQIGEEAVNTVGPALNHVFGRAAGAVDDYVYSPAMQTKGAEGLVWLEKSLYVFLAGPDRYVPGTTMGFPGLRGEQEIKDLLAFLIRFSPAYEPSSGEPVAAEVAAASQVPAWSAGAGEAETPDLSAAFLSSPDSIATGGKLWAGQCRHCHGNSAYPGKAPKLVPAHYKPKFVFDRVTNGFRKMPAWKSVFTLEERQSIVAYLLSDKFSP